MTGWKGRHIFIDICPHFSYELTNLAYSTDAFGRGYSRMRSECGACARTDTVCSRAALGIMLAGTTAGAGGAFPGLGQAGAGNAR